MPQKRRIQGTMAPSDALGEDQRPKKRRVSLACDACRAAREKCDGTKPQCGTCVALDRACSYTPATKKRGVQTGYLRTIELSLAWLFDHMPESEQSLHQLLVQSTASRECRALLGKGSAGHRLQKIWNENRVRKAIDALLSDSQTMASYLSDIDSTAENSCQTHPHDAPQPPKSRLPRSSTVRFLQNSPRISGFDQSPGVVLRLPARWKRLLNVYVSYTHCWLPIAWPDVLRSLATSYGDDGICMDLDADRSAYSHHSELWAALAIASFQDTVSQDDKHSPDLSPSQIFHIARSLMPRDDETYDIHSVSAIILHSAIFIGRGKAFPASLSLSKAAQLLKQLQLDSASASPSPSPSPSPTYNSNNLERIQKEIAGVACSFLDTLTSLSISQHAMTDVCNTANAISPSTAEFSGFDQVWHAVPRADLPEISPRASHPTMEPIRTLMQLHAFTTVLSGIMSPRRHRDTHIRPVGPEDLVHKLDSRFNFCNSLISSGSTPTIPSAFLVKLLFLTATIELASHLRSSLLSGFLELVESCFANFGASRTPPVVCLLLQIVQKRTRVSEMSEAEQSCWRSAVGKIHDIWHDAPESNLAPTSASPSRIVEQTVPQPLCNPIQSVPDQAFDSTRTHPASHNGVLGVDGDGDGLPADKYGAEAGFGYQSAVRSSTSTYPLHLAGLLPTHFGDGRTNTQMSFPGAHRINQNFDYDALFEDLGSIGYTDTMDMDTRFMTNLGFAPGCDLAEIVQGDFGL